MKNIHIIPTDKPSRLSILNSGKLNFGAEIMSSSNSKPQHIYITSDEEIKEGDWYLTFLNKEVIGKPRKCEDTNWNFCGYKKIILTTDQDLDNVQAIDDEFLEWFVKNPSCEKVEIESWQTKGEWDLDYKIIIPKEEPKDVVLGYKTSLDAQMLDKIEPKQETLEEASEKMFNDFKEKNPIVPHSHINPYKMGFIHCAKYQSERMYSEEDMRKAFIAGGNSQIEEDDAYGSEYLEYMEEWFKQFKKEDKQ